MNLKNRLNYIFIFLIFNIYIKTIFASTHLSVTFINNTGINIQISIANERCLNYTESESKGKKILLQPQRIRQFTMVSEYAFLYDCVGLNKIAIWEITSPDNAQFGSSFKWSKVYSSSHKWEKKFNKYKLEGYRSPFCINTILPKKGSINIYISKPCNNSPDGGCDF